VESDLISLEDSVYHYLPDSIVSNLHVYGGHDYSRDMTARQLLNHTSGLPDYVTDGDADGDGISDFLEILMAEPTKFWTPEETIEYAKRNLTPFFPPGGGFHYSDTDYQLLGLIIQRITGRAFNAAYRDSLFEPLGMTHTYTEFYDTPVPSQTGRGLSRVYFGTIDYTDWESASADWAGGGLVSTCDDLTRFIRAFADGRIFRKPETKGQMQVWINAGEAGVYYGFGTERLMFSGLGLAAYGEVWGHSGFPNSFMFYWPQQDATIVGTLNQAIPEQFTSYDVITAVLHILRTS
jgi:CubicO group peptidase (beta-lactamase class C family)